MHLSIRHKTGGTAIGVGRVWEIVEYPLSLSCHHWDCTTIVIVLILFL
jgi:hypothetical protein